ncbi:outer membrane, partial [Trichoderma cornu-damae]
SPDGITSLSRVESMATDTDTLSLPTTTAPTEVAADVWDTSVTANFHFAAKMDRPSNSATAMTTTATMTTTTATMTTTTTTTTATATTTGSPQHQTQQPQQQQEQGGDATVTGKYVAQTSPDGCDRPLKRRPSSDCWLTSNLLSSYRSVEESCKRSLEHFPCPSVSFAMPALEFDFRIAVALNPEPSRIENRVQKEITTIKGGRWSGSFGNGRVMAGGYDLGQARGFRPIRIVEGAFVLQTTDQPPAMLEMRTRGSLSGPCDVLDTLLSARESKENIDPRQYGFRTFATVKTADKRYAEFVNCGLWVASGVWRGEELIIE